MLFFNIIKAVPFLVHVLFYNHKKMGVPSKMLSVFIERKIVLAWIHLPS